jgi:hypothetical protein
MDGVTNIISPVGRALQQKLSSMNQEQFQQYVMQQMNAGVIRSFPEILALKSQYDALQKGSKQQPAPQGTVADEMAMQMAQPAPQAPMPNAGLAGLPPAQEGYARGGVVAFAKAGTVGAARTGSVGSRVPGAEMTIDDLIASGAFDDLTPEENAREIERLKKQQQWNNARTAAPAAPAAGPAPAAAPAAPAGGTPSPAGGGAAPKKPGFFKRALTSARNTNVGSAGQVGASAGSALLKIPAAGAVIGGLRSFGQELVNNDPNEIREGYKRQIAAGVYGDPEEQMNNSWNKFLLTDYAQMPEGERPFYAPLSDPTLKFMSLLSSTAGGGDVLGLTGIRNPRDVAREAQAVPPAAEKKDEGLPLPVGPRIDFGSGMGRINVPAPPSIPAGMGAWNGPKEEAPKGRDKYLEELRLRYQSEGIGAKDAEYQAQLAADRKELEYDKRVAPWLALAQAGFRMAAEGGKSGATFLGSAGAGAEEGLKTYKELKSDIKKTNREQQKAERDFATAKELRTMGMMKDADALQSDAEKRYDTIMLAKAEHATKLLQMKFQQEGLYYGARMNAIIAEYGARNRMDVQEKIINGMNQILSNAGSDAKSQAAARKQANDYLTYWSTSLGTINKNIGAGLAASLKAQGLGGGAGPQPNGVAEVTTP